MAERRRPSRKRSSAATSRARPAKAAKRPRAKAAKKPTAKTKRAAKKTDPHAAVRRYRERMRAKGLRPVTIWVPDVSDPEFVARFQAGIAAVAEHERTSPQARDDAEFWEKVAAEAWDDLPDYDWGPDGPPKG